MTGGASAGALLQTVERCARELAALRVDHGEGDDVADVDSMITSIATKLEDALQQLSEVAQAQGLASDETDAGYSLALSGTLTSQDACKLLQSLLPYHELSAKSALCIVSSMGETVCSRPASAGRVEYDVQAFALWQLYFLLDRGSVSRNALWHLRGMYSIIEAGLNYSRLSEPTACILQLLMSGAESMAHRVDHLQRRLSQQDRASMATRRLLEQYQAYDLTRVYPSPGEVVQGGPAALPDGISMWRDNVEKVAATGAHAVNREPARSRTASTPTELARRIETLALPSQASSTLLSLPPTGKTPRVRAATDPERVLSWTCLLKAGYDNDYPYLHRLSYWANTELLHDLRSANAHDDADSHTADILARVRDLSVYGGELFEAIEPFLAEFLLSWDGLKHRETVFELITLLKPFDIGSLRKHYLDRLEELASARSADPVWIADLVACLASLVTNLASRDDWFNDASGTTAFGALDLESYLDSLQAVVDSAGHIIETAVSTHPNSLVLRSSALHFHRVALDLPLELDLPIASLPSPVLAHVCLLGNDIASLSEICGLIHRLRQALTGAESVLSKDDDASARMIALLNRTIIDFVNTLWQKRLLRSQGERGAFGLDEVDIEPLLDYAQAVTESAANSLGITTHPALAELARKCLEEFAASANKSIEGLEGVVTSGSLKKLAVTPNGLDVPYADFRPALVEWLHARGAEGLGDLLFASLQSLLTRRVSQGLQA
ncbi:hypothetical protein JCM3774_005050 [Rhodotorula dairenensis]